MAERRVGGLMRVRDEEEVMKDSYLRFLRCKSQVSSWFILRRMKVYLPKH